MFVVAVESGVSPIRGEPHHNGVGGGGGAQPSTLNPQPCDLIVVGGEEVEDVGLEKAVKKVQHRPRHDEVLQVFWG